MSDSLSKKYQTLILELDDGRKVTAVIPVTFRAGDRITIKGVKVTDPRPLPKDTSWGTL